MITLGGITLPSHPRPTPLPQMQLMEIPNRPPKKLPAEPLLNPRPQLKLSSFHSLLHRTRHRSRTPYRPKAPSLTKILLSRAQVTLPKPTPRRKRKRETTGRRRRRRRMKGGSHASMTGNCARQSSQQHAIISQAHSDLSVTLLSLCDSMIRKMLSLFYI